MKVNSIGAINYQNTYKLSNNSIDLKNDNETKKNNLHTSTSDKNVLGDDESDISKESEESKEKIETKIVTTNGSRVLLTLRNGRVCSSLKIGEDNALMEDTNQKISGENISEELSSIQESSN